MMHAHRWLAVATIALGTLVTGCWSTTVSSGQPVGATPPEWDGKWHSSLFAGIVELSGPYDVHAICPEGWAEVQTKTSLWNGLLILVTLDTYSTQTVTVRCARKGATARANEPGKAE